ncbi:MAG: hypothetical protein AAB276_00170 [Pseudomonadota bacterium]
MKKVILSALLLASTLAMAACSTAQSSEAANGDKVFEKKVTK